MRFDGSPIPPRPARRAAAVLARVAGAVFLAGALLAAPATTPMAAVVPAMAAAQEHASAEPLQPGKAEGIDMEHGAEEHAEGILPTIARLFNFAILAGVLVYFLRDPIQSYLANRSGQIRQDLVTAAETRAAATAQLAAIEEQLTSLPGELDALKARGAEDVRLERERIAEAAAAERNRLLEHTRREIDMRLRVAHRALTEEAAGLAVGVAQARLERMLTADDQLRLVDRYADQLGAAR